MKKEFNTSFNPKSALTLMHQKQIVFLSDYENMTLREIADCFDLPDDTVDPFAIAQILQSIFFDELLADDDFLALNVIGHFNNQKGQEVFGLTLYDVYDCEERYDTVSQWFAIVINHNEGTCEFTDCTCYDSVSVRNSRFRGKPIRQVAEYITELFETDVFIH